jgi:hypothetical protein
MDEAAFRQKFSAMIERPCTFEKAILAGCVSCPVGQRIQIAEREAVACEDKTSLTRCTLLHELLRHNFAFALKNKHIDSVLSHVQELRVQCGGLTGLQQILDGTTGVTDVDLLLDDVSQKWGGLAEVPFSEVVHAAAQNFKGRRG